MKLGWKLSKFSDWWLGVGYSHWKPFPNQEYWYFRLGVGLGTLEAYHLKLT